MIVGEASAESELWRRALVPDGERELVPVFSPLGQPRHALGLETIYEGYLLHYGRPRLFAPADRDTGLLLGDHLYAHGLVRIAALDEAREALRDRGDPTPLVDAARARAGDEAVARSLDLHLRRVG